MWLVSIHRPHISQDFWHALDCLRSCASDGEIFPGFCFVMNKQTDDKRKEGSSMVQDGSTVFIEPLQRDAPVSGATLDQYAPQHHGARLGIAGNIHRQVSAPQSLPGDHRPLGA